VPIPTRTTLSYAVLGLLALRPMNAYDLVQGYRRSLGQVMHRSEAAIYAEPKRLEADGLLTSTEEQRGRRVVPVYEITDTGRAELRSWLDAPPTFPLVDAEPVLRAVFADQGDLEQLRRSLAAFRDDALTRSFALQAIPREYLRAAGPYQHRSPLVALSGRFVVDLYVLYVHWCDWALAAVDAWLDGRVRPDEWALEQFAGMAGELAHLTEGRVPPA
jgi:DNA-binding PadR family transcriptional regulator